MKVKNLLLVVFFFIVVGNIYAQLLCIKCYNKNARVLIGSNNLIVNGGFENTTCSYGFGNSFCPNSSYYDCNITNWTCTGGGAATLAYMVDTTYSIIVEGTKAAYMAEMANCHICSTNFNDTSCMVNTSCEVTGIPAGYPVDIFSNNGHGVSLAQTINGLSIGVIYSLEFWAGGYESTGNKGLFAVDVGFGNIYLRNPDTKHATQDTIGIRYVIVFTATSTSHTIKFTAWGYIDSNLKGPEVVLDDVRLFAANPDESNICTTAINDLPQNAVETVFPNPATNRLTITTISNQPSEIILLDIASRQLMEEKFSGSATLNIESLAKGVYLYEVRDEKGMVKQGKVVKE